MLVNNKLLRKYRVSESGIYKLSCNDCDFIYLGQTDRNFDIRLKVYIKHCNINNPALNVAKHILDNYSCNPNNFSILRKIEKDQR